MQLEQRISILIVEDQAFMRQSLRDFLQSAYPQAAILEAPDGASALEHCRSHGADLVLMDVHLPDANGIIVAAEIKKKRPQTIVIMVSQHAGTAYVERARVAGAFAYITKDKVYRELVPTINRALGGEPLTADSGAHAQK
jgi:DNA-binding NarL/FixJ family response regulator